MSQIVLTESGIVAACPECGQRNRLKFEKLGDSFRCGKCQTAIRPPDQPADAAEETAFFAAIASSSIPVLVDFWAPWCGPCKMVEPEVKKFAAEASGKLLVLKVNTESVPRLAAQYEISGIPTFMVFKRGQPAARQSGAMSAQHLKRFVDAAL